MTASLTRAAMLYALDLVKRWKRETAHENCVHDDFVVRMADIIMPDGSFGQKPYAILTGNITSDKNCDIARIILRDRCRHGTYVGPPSGIDYLCGLCENGDDESLYERAISEARGHQKRLTDHVIERAQKAVMEELISISKADANMFGWIDPDVVARLVRAGD